jgi:hypothetical protein
MVWRSKRAYLHRPVRKRIRANLENAGMKPYRESEVVIVPKKRGKAAWREGPLLPLRVPKRERLLDCAREGKLNPSE